MNSIDKFIDINEIISEIKQYQKNFDEKRFIKAFEFANLAHVGQIRKDGKTPYIVHPLEVVRILSHLKADEDTILAALMHDVPEDTERTLEDIKKEFGEHVEFLVDGVTKISNMETPTLKKLFSHSVKDRRVFIIKLADRLHNMRTLDHLKREKQIKFASQTLEIFVPIARQLGIGKLYKEMEDLCIKYLYPDKYREVVKSLKKIQKKQKGDMQRIITWIKNDLNILGTEVKVSARKSNIYSYFKKIADDGEDTSNLVKLLRVNIEVSENDECYRVLGRVHAKFKPVNKKFKDYIANPRSNGYRSLITTVFGLNSNKLEFHIYTNLMKLEADYGVTLKNFEKINPCSQIEDMHIFEKIAATGQNLSIGEDYLENFKNEYLNKRISVFSSDGVKYDIPDGASIIDFAYMVSKRAGDHLGGAKVNEKIVRISATVKNGDILELSTNKNFHPFLGWLDFIKTETARVNIKKYLKDRDVKTKIMDGRKEIQKAFDLAGLGSFHEIEFAKVKKIVSDEWGINFESWEDLFLRAGEGDIKILRLVQLLRDKKLSAGVLTKLIDRLFGWEDTDKLDVTFKVYSKDDFGLAGDVAQIFYRHSMDLKYFEARLLFFKQGSSIKASAQVKDFEKVMEISNELTQIRGVEKVVRIYHKSKYLILLQALSMSILILLFNLRNKIVLDGFAKVNLLTFISIISFFNFYFIWYLNKYLRIYIPDFRDSIVFFIFTTVIPWVIATDLIAYIAYRSLPFYYIRPLNFALSLGVFIGIYGKKLFKKLKFRFGITKFFKI